MAVDSPVPLVVLGPADMFVTALVAAFRSRGILAEGVGLPAPHRARAALDGRDVGLLVVDLGLDDGIDVVADAVADGWTVLAVGRDRDREAVAAAVAAGASGWVPRSSPFDTLATAVQDVVAGRLLMTGVERAEWLAMHRAVHEDVLESARRLGLLTQRERQVLGMLVDRLRATDISSRLFLSITTVRSHIRSILVKLGVNSQERAVEVYRDNLRRRPREVEGSFGR